MALKSVNLNDLSFDELVSKDLIERFINELEPKIRLEFTIYKTKNKDGQASISERHDSIVLLGELCKKLRDGEYDNEFTLQEKNTAYSRILDAYKYSLENETNCVPHHELAYQIAARDMRELSTLMKWSALHHKSVVSRHEFLENLAIISDWDSLKTILPQALQDSSEDIRQTAEYCVDKMRRYEHEPPLGALEIV